MTEALAELLPVGRQALLVGFLVFLRIGAMIALVPAFGERAVPVRIRLALALCFSAIVGPAVATQYGDLTSAAFRPGMAIAAEVTAGLALGISFRLFVLALQIAGTIAANMTSLSQILGGLTVDPQPAIANLLTIAGLALAAMLGLHVKVAEAMIQSYWVFPPGQIPLAGELADWGTRQVAYAFGLAFSLAAPFTVASLIYNLALGAINRAMPQLMVAFVGAPAITGGALILLVLAAPIMLASWLAAFDAALVDPFGAR